MTTVEIVWGGKRSAPKPAPKKEEKPAESKTKIDSSYRKVQLNNLDQAKRLLGVGGFNSSVCSDVRTANGQDFLKCGDTEYEFDDLSDSSNGEGGRVYKSLQQYFCDGTGESVENDSCMKEVVRVWGGTRTVKKAEPKKEETKPEPKPIVLKSSAKEECERNGNHLWLNGKECKAIGDKCEEYYGRGEGKYARASDGKIRCKLSVCKTDGYEVNKSDGGYTCYDTRSGMTKGNLFGDYSAEYNKVMKEQQEKDEARRKAAEEEKRRKEQEAWDKRTKVWAESVERQEKSQQEKRKMQELMETLCVKAGCGSNNVTCLPGWNNTHTQIDVKCDGKNISKSFGKDDPTVQALDALDIHK